MVQLCVVVMTVGTSYPTTVLPYVRPLAVGAGVLAGAFIAWRAWPKVFGVGFGMPNLHDPYWKYYDDFNPTSKSGGKYGTKESWELSQEIGRDAQKVLGYNTYPVIGACAANVNDAKKAILITAEGWPNAPYIWEQSAYEKSGFVVKGTTSSQLQNYRMVVSNNFRDSELSFRNGIFPLLATARHFNLGGTFDLKTIMHLVLKIFKAYPEAPLVFYCHSRGGGVLFRLLYALFEYDAYASEWQALGCLKTDAAKILENIKKGGHVVLAKPAVNRRAVLKNLSETVLTFLPWVNRFSWLKNIIATVCVRLALVTLALTTEYGLWEAEVIDQVEELVKKGCDLSFVSVYCAGDDGVVGKSQDARLQKIAHRVIGSDGVETKNVNLAAGIGSFTIVCEGHNDNKLVQSKSKLFA